MNKFIYFNFNLNIANMNRFFVCLVIGFLSLPYALNAQLKDHISDSVEIILQFKNMYRYQNFYLSGQPSYEALQWLTTKDVNVIVNLRTEKENNDFASASYNEELIAKQLGFKYLSLPVDGIKDYTPDKLQEFSVLLEGNDPIFIHCASAGRVTYFFMAYLIKCKGYSIDQAVSIGKKLTFSFPLENLLDTKISMEIRD